MVNVNWFDALDGEGEPELRCDLSVSEWERDIIMSVEEECRRLKFEFDYLTCLTTIKTMNGTKGTNGAADKDSGKGSGDKKTHS